MVKLPSLLFNFLPSLNPCIKAMLSYCHWRFFDTAEGWKEYFSLSLAFRTPEHKRSYSSRDGVPHRDCNMLPVGRQGSVWTASPAIPSANSGIPATPRHGAAPALAEGSRTHQVGAPEQTPLCAELQLNRLHQKEKKKSCLPPLSIRFGAKKIFKGWKTRRKYHGIVLSVSLVA